MVAIKAKKEKANMKPKVVINNEVYQKIMFWVDKSPDEISGLGTVIFDKKEQQFRVVSAMLLPQKNGPASTDIEAEDVCKAMYELRESEGELRFWWHSHVNMGVFWSGTDHATIASISQGGWVLSSVFNKKREVKSSFRSTDYLFPLFLDDLETIYEMPKFDTKEWEAEYEKNCQKKVYTPTYPGQYPYYQDWNSRSGEWERRHTGTPSLTVETISATEKSDALAKNKRPVNMSKKEWKRLKRENQERFQLEKLENKVSDSEQTSFPYPFSQSEMTSLAQSGITMDDVDTMLNGGWTKDEILEFIANPYDDDVPVADRRHEFNGLGEWGNYEN